MSHDRRRRAHGEQPVAARRCAFCLSRDALTREHVWPRWLKEFLPDEPRWSSRIRVGRRGSTPATDIAEPFGAPDRVSLTTKCACRRCNNGWMSRLESDGRTTIGPLVAGELEQLDHEQSSVAARWLMKTAVAISAAASQPWLLDPTTGQALREGYLPQSEMRVAVARVSVPKLGFMAAATLRRPETRAPGALFVDLIEGHLAASVAVASRIDPPAGWFVLLPPAFASISPAPFGVTSLPTVTAEEVVGAQIARIKLVEMTGEGTLEPLP